jgi:hypothetical protein
MKMKRGEKLKKKKKKKKTRTFFLARRLPQPRKPLEHADLESPRVHTVVGLDEGVAEVVDAEAREALEGLVGVEVEVVRVSRVFFVFFLLGGGREAL